MVARPVPQQHRMHPGRQLLGELLQEQVDYCGGVHVEDVKSQRLIHDNKD